MRRAGVDIGTNSVRLLIEDDAGRELERQMQITRLGQGIDQSGRLHPDAIARTTAVLEQYRALLEQHRVDRVRAAATSAARDARNGQDFLDAAELALGVRPEVLAGADEARMSFRGATKGLPSGEGPFLVIDIGGGSTELVLGAGGGGTAAALRGGAVDGTAPALRGGAVDGTAAALRGGAVDGTAPALRGGASEPEALISVDVGCVRMTERHLRSDPPTLAQLSACVADVERELAEVQRVIDRDRARTVIGTAGTITTLAAMELGLTRYDASRTHHARLTRAAVQRNYERLARATIAERRAMLAEPKRAEVILGGACVLVTLMRVLAIDELTVSETDILDGLCESA